jgi:elongation factor Tu
VVTGRIEAGSVRVGDEVDIVGLAGAAKKSVVTGVEMFK